MSAGRHTRGPWKAQISAAFVGGNSYSIFTAHENRSAQAQDLVAASFPGTVHGHGPANISGPEARANAALIAAAPDLLSALQDFEIEECPSCSGTGKEHGTDDHNACHRCGGAGEVLRGGWPAHVRAAIAKAQAAE
jgi:hypothetical protein